jgi:hypothetical protein
MEPASGAEKALAKKNAARAARQMLIRSAPPAILLWAFVSGSHYMSRLELNIGYAMLWGSCAECWPRWAIRAPSFSCATAVSAK